MNQYIVNVSHDGGKATFIVIASSIQSAIEKVMKAEGCPECAINSIRKTNKKITII